MRRTFKSLSILVIICFSSFVSFGQEVSGVITDSKTKEPLFAANVVIKGTAIGATTDFDGKFKFNAGRKPPFTLSVTYIGYLAKEVEVTSISGPINIDMSTDAVLLKSVEIVESRISDKQKESALTVESMDVLAIKETPAASFYEGLGALKGVDLTTASIGFKVINTRGFNSTSPVRSLQIIDGVDNQSPGLNFSLGNFLGASELDVLKVDIIQGASSAFYGPNAFNGVIAMTTKSPFVKPGISLQYKVGERGLNEVALRHAHVFKNKIGEDKFGYKLNLYYLQANDWEATNLNPVDDSPVGADNPGGYDAVNRYGDEDLAGGNDFREGSDLKDYPGLGLFYRPGYEEKDLVDYNTRNLKAGLALHYKIKPDVEAIIASNFGTGTTVYQGENRFSLKNILFYQNRLEFQKKDKWFFRVYSTNEDAGDSYDAVVAAFKMLDTRKSLRAYYTQYSSYWFSNIRARAEQLDGYPQWVFGQPTDTAGIRAVIMANPDSMAAWHAETRDFAAYQVQGTNGQPYYEVGTAEYDQLFRSVTSTIYTDNRIEGGGARFYDRSALYHAHGEYKFEPEILGVNIGQFTVGANGRLYVPDSRGTIFDEMVLARDTVPGILQPDSAVVDTSFRQIYNWEFGVYVGWEKKFFEEQLKVSLAARLDKNQNFPFLVSPAASLVYQPTKDHTIRAGFSSAIRNPTLSDQYLNYDVGRARLLGNLDGYDSLITVESFVDYINGGRADTILSYFDVDRIVPEKVKTFEVGYRGFFFQHVYLDASYYFSIYDDFIGYEIGIESTFDPFGFPVKPKVYRVASNSKNTVTTQGASIGINYYFKNKYTLSGNYSWNKLTTKIDDPIIPAFNTPEHKFNLGISARDLLWARRGNFGFGINYKWIKGFLFEGSPQFTGFVNSYDAVNAQVSFTLLSKFLTFKLGASNLFGIIPFFEEGTAAERFSNAFDNRQVQVYGGPAIGRMAYFSILFEWN